MKLINFANAVVLFAFALLLFAGYGSANPQVINGYFTFTPTSSIEATVYTYIVVQPGTQFTSLSTSMILTHDDRIYHDPTTCPSGYTPTYTNPKGGHIDCSVGAQTYIPVAFMIMSFTGGVLLLVWKPIF